MKTRIILADDHKIMREGLRSLLAREPEMEVVAEAGNGRDCVDLARKLEPDLVVMDIGMPDLNGIEATRQIRADHPEVKVLALSMHSDRRFASAMLAAGASGYLLKDSAFEELSQAIQAVLEGQTYLSPAIAGLVVEDYVQRLGEEPSPFSVLRPREREVLQAMAEGKSTREIAEALHISVKTVETHRQNIMNALGLRSVAELTKYAIREGLTSLDS
ncbi:MAG: response regulator transcription factor [candidate division WS1 bacterium]|nr:response regulator transcription factor [candidate division WS1 bacterium]